MGKAVRWFKGLLGMKKEKEKEKSNPNTSNPITVEKKDAKRWSFGGRTARDGESQIRKSITSTANVPSRGRVPSADPSWLRSYETEQSKHAIAVAAATAAAADAAVAAAQAAVEVVRLTSNGRGTLLSGGREKWAAVKIQTCFRGFLARKALRALKGLVKLQALVRGYLVRKRAAATLQSMQALIRAQNTIRTQRVHRSLTKDAKFRHDIRPRKSIERYDDLRGEIHSKRLSAPVDPNSAFEDTSPKIVEIDTYKPRSRSRRMNMALSECGEDIFCQGISSPLPLPGPTPARISTPARFSIPNYDNNSHDFDWCFNGDELKFPTAQSTPRFVGSAAPFAPPTPAKSICGEGYYGNNYLNCHPNYMASTQSFKAKLRSYSAPRQRPEPGMRKRLSLNEIMAARNSISGVRMQRSSCSQLQEAVGF